MKVTNESLEGWSNEVIDNFEFLDWDGVSVNLFQRSDFSIFDKSS